jgi:hypothetical protein
MEIAGFAVTAATAVNDILELGMRIHDTVGKV